MIPSSPRCVGASMVNEGETHVFAVETVGGVIIASSLGI
jgi:hypothetical protein